MGAQAVAVEPLCRHPEIVRRDDVVPVKHAAGLVAGHLHRNPRSGILSRGLPALCEADDPFRLTRVLRARMPVARASGGEARAGSPEALWASAGDDRWAPGARSGASGWRWCPVRAGREPKGRGPRPARGGPPVKCLGSGLGVRRAQGCPDRPGREPLWAGGHRPARGGAATDCYFLQPSRGAGDALSESASTQRRSFRKA